MAILIDADVLIHSERGRFDLLSWIHSQTPDHGVLAAITVAEFRHGIERASGMHRMRRQRFLEEILLPVFPVVPYTEATAEIHARIWAECQVAGRMIGPHDLILAAGALEHSASVATFNARHFSSVPGLHVITPELP
jgi:predicted nucleic acid-binding protein